MTDDREMVELVDDAAPVALDAHAVMSERIRVNSSGNGRPGLIQWNVDDPLSKVQEWVQSRTGLAGHDSQLSDNRRYFDYYRWPYYGHPRVDRRR